MMSNARTLLCAVPQPVADVCKPGRRRRFLNLTLTAGLIVGLQGFAAGPAAVATLPSALMTRPVAAAVPQPVTTGSLITASMDFTPKLIKDPSLFKAILDGAFSFRKPHAVKPAPREMQDEAAGDPDELIPFNGRNVPRWLVHSILKAAHVTGVDPVYMMTLADVESSLSPEAKAPTSSAQGLFQFIDRTWLEIVQLHAADYGFAAAAEAIKTVDGDPVVGDRDRAWIMNLRTDPYFSALMAGELIKDVERALQAQGERELAEAELYLAHFLGASSAVRFLEVLDRDPNMKASKLFPKAAKANAGLFMEGKGRKRRPVSVAELYNKIDSKIVRRLDRYEGIGPYLAEISRQSEERTSEASALVQ
ncbi:transglycosylase SLT domain-containing protein [Microvirga lotononidis]|uniref:Transglycosylase family protein n=1 Tax=Microvirga lotononidis TaxID=864069 RepID=I4YNK8_9HYPH|nr:transglycosylase SLT domain-containing protein [Microvirga lotononidis]EIM25550.1 transglycosylase family protein [Microvirga lotononidis]WQO26142.1 transglycosylase SLT domain-containing protein [Microvirga lotononidis]